MANDPKASNALTLPLPADPRRELWLHVLHNAIRVGTKGPQAAAEADEVLAAFDRRFPA